jgi:hypothetical protein
MRTIIALLPVVAVAITLPCNAQDASKPKPNIAVSGCLLREGYGTYIVSRPNVDAAGEGVDAAKPGAKSASREAPAKFILDHPGPMGPHVGEMVQVIGVSSWADEGKAGAQQAQSDEPPSAPHIDVQTVKVVASSCS